MHGTFPGDEPLTLMRCHSFIKPWKDGNPSVGNPTTEGCKGENFLNGDTKDKLPPKYTGRVIPTHTSTQSVKLMLIDKEEIRKPCTSHTASKFLILK